MALHLRGLQFPAPLFAREKAQKKAATERHNLPGYRAGGSTLLRSPQTNPLPFVLAFYLPADVPE
ncbi:hypothetical protein D3C71_2057110 [compost metagenome]